MNGWNMTLSRKHFCGLHFVISYHFHSQHNITTNNRFFWPVNRIRTVTETVQSFHPRFLNYSHPILKMLHWSFHWEFSILSMWTFRHVGNCQGWVVKMYFEQNDPMKKCNLQEPCDYLITWRLILVILF